MRIEIENTSSPGTSFTENTNEVLLKTSDWIQSHAESVLPFKEFRMTLQREKGINDNNLRNIYPLLKNSGLIQYENRGSLAVKHFFTKTGQAYVTALDTKRLLRADGPFSDAQKQKATQKLDRIIAEIIRDALAKLFSNQELNYIEPFKGFISYLLTYEKINKVEFAYFLFERKSASIADALKNMQPNVAAYRAGTLTFDVNVSVLNDIKLREKTNSDKRKEGLSFLTSYTYFSSLLLQANLIVKQDGYFVLNPECRDELEKLLEV